MTKFRVNNIHGLARHVVDGNYMNGMVVITKRQHNTALLLVDIVRRSRGLEQ